MLHPLPIHCEVKEDSMTIDAAPPIQGGDDWARDVTTTDLKGKATRAALGSTDARGAKLNLPNEPLVSVVTPVYNGALYLRECIESVLAQTYSNWEYTIVNNCSTDATLQIAEEYARKDRRIHVYSNEALLPIIANHNRAFRLISPESKYCKVVSADDWLFPECIARMVDLAEAYPSVGIVGSYQLSGSGSNWRAWHVRWSELPYPSSVIPGREVCRLHLLGISYVFGTPTSVLYRSVQVRGQEEFYPNSTAEADTSACYKYLQNTDFGFVHQVLSYERVHQQSQSAECRSLNSYASSRIRDLIEYGPNCLSTEELNKRLEESLDYYYTFLGASVFHFRDKTFWNYHKKRLKELGHPLSYVRLAKEISVKLFDLLLNPKQTAEKVLRRGATA
jgi:glycosyltransferase involved in cell wall biosynthesis